MPVRNGRFSSGVTLSERDPPRFCDVLFFVLASIGSFGRPLRQAGDFHWIHNIAIGSQGSVFTAKVEIGKRAQRFIRVP